SIGKDRRFNLFLAFLLFLMVASTFGRLACCPILSQVPLTNLPVCLDGYSLAMVSDLHAGPTVGRSEVR
ncbi:unnamed protein product, partial [Ectocarpus sp. 13 AM-2016]